MPRQAQTPALKVRLMPRFRRSAAFLVSLVAFFILAVISMRATYGDYAGEFGPLWGPIGMWQTFAEERGVPTLGYATSDALIYSPAFAIGLITFAWLRRRQVDGYLHCTKCNHILKGLTAPRCPECGTTI